MMWKKINTIIFSIILVGVLAIPVLSADNSVTKGTFGFLMQEGQSPEKAYSFGGDFPILSDSGKTLITGIIADVLYSDRVVSKEDVTIGEVAGARLFVVAIKKLPANLYISLGVGDWTLVNTVGNDVNYVAYRAGFGWSSPLWGIDMELNTDIVRCNGPDMYFVGLSLTLLDI